MTATVAIVQKFIPHYRVPFFERLRTLLAERGVALRLIYGQPDAAGAAKGDTVDVAWGHRITNRILSVAGRTVYWQPCLERLQGADLIIVEQANSLLLNYWLQARYLLGGTPLAFWGHGRNFQATGGAGLSEKLKAYLATHVHWWFAYNDRSRAHLEAIGYPPSRITSVQNAIDTDALRAQYRALGGAAVRRLRDRLGLQGDHVGLFVGGMYADKRLPFLLEACRRIRAQVPDFEMLFAGAGADAPLVEAAAREHAWIHYLGPVFGDDKIACFKLADLLLMPGLVGLVILDTFALETPIVTTRDAPHSPEIAYLDSGSNGWMVEAATPQAYAEAVATLLTSEATRRRLADGCRQSAHHYTVDAMAQRFADGIEAALTAATSRIHRDVHV